MSGTLDLVINTRTPLLIGGGAARAGDEELRTFPRSPDDTDAPVIPGSALHGAVRVLFEALTDSCLRVVDLDYRPVHRDIAQPPSRGRTPQMAVVCEVTDTGLPTKVRLQGTDPDDVVYIAHDALPLTHEGLLTSGDRVRLTVRPTTDKGKYRVRRASTTSPMVRVSELEAVSTDTYAVLITDTKARAAAQPCWFAAVRPAGDVVAVSSAAMDDFSACLELVDDRRPGAPQDDAVPVTWPSAAGRPGSAPPTIGYRLNLAGGLRVGQPVWVTIHNDQVTRVTPSFLWRHRGEHAVGERIGDAAPCTEVDALCPACRLFGSAGADDDDPQQRTGGTRQSSYRGHVRFLDAVAQGPVDVQVFDLAPLSSPHPSAGQFYLRTASGLRLPGNKDKPLALWGSAADDRSPRPIAGRKFYWRTDAPAAEGEPGPVHRGSKRPHHKDKVTVRAEAVPAGARFSTTVAFENLDDAQLGGLLAALDPRRIFPDAEVVSVLGGGKPFGFGSLTVDVAEARVTRGADRYRPDKETEPVDLDACVAAFADGHHRAADTSRWAALSHVLTLGFLGDALVWYPPGSTGRPGQEAFDQGFDFWSNTRGIEVEEGTGPHKKIASRNLVALPDPAGSAEAQTLDRRGNVTRRPKPPNSSTRGQGARGNNRRGGKR